MWTHIPCQLSEEMVKEEKRVSNGQETIQNMRIENINNNIK